MTDGYPQGIGLLVAIARWYCTAGINRGESQGRSRQHRHRPPKSDVYIYEEIEKVWSGDMTPEQYLQGLDDLFQTELKAGDIPPIPAREVKQ